jgi:hypothetical protein
MAQLEYVAMCADTRRRNAARGGLCGIADA